MTQDLLDADEQRVPLRARAAAVGGEGERARGRAWQPRRVVGQVTKLKDHSQKNALPFASFRLQAVDEDLPPMQVIVTGSRFVASLNEGDEIELEAWHRAERPLRAVQIRNRNTHVTLRTPRLSRWLYRGGLGDLGVTLTSVVAALGLIAAAVAAVAFLGEGDGVDAAIGIGLGAAAVAAAYLFWGDG